MHNKAVIGTFFASLRFGVAAPLYPKTPLHKKRPIQQRYAKTMNRVRDITQLRFNVSGQTFDYPCVSGRLKYGKGIFSIKCRVLGGDGICEESEFAESIEVSSAEKVVLIDALTNIELLLESVSVSVIDQSSNSQYLIHGCGEVVNA